jgi:hypothetical protein
MNLTIGDVATLLGVGSILFGGALAYIMSRAGNVFAGRADVARLEEEVRELQVALQGTVKHSEMNQVFDRLRAVETGVAVSNEGLASVKASTSRIEHQLSLIVQSQLAREATDRARA